MAFSPAVRQKIMYDNAARLLGLQPRSSSAEAGAGIDLKMQDLVGEIVREVMACLGR